MGDDGKFYETAKRMRKVWFRKLRNSEQDAIIRPHFEKAYPTNAAKRSLLRSFECDPEWYKE